MAYYVLFESAYGYALFQRGEMQEAASQADEIQEAIKSFPLFQKMIKQVAFIPFTSAENALENINAISEGILTELLTNFLETNLPTKNRSKITVGVSEDKIGSSIQEALGVTCVRTGPVQELIRGIRQHLSKFTEISENDLEKAQLGLGHRYSRAKVKFNIHKVDNMVIQSIALLDQLDKDVNTFSMRVRYKSTRGGWEGKGQREKCKGKRLTARNREWYSWHFPELARIVADNYLFAKLVKLIKNKSTITEDSVDAITEIVNDADKAKEIYSAARTSMGTDISEIDLKSLEDFTDKVVNLTDYRQKLHQYLLKKMGDCAPNLSALMGEIIGARLIARAGSLTNLAKFPASTVQILGAERALFQALKKKGNTPKHGIIFHSGFIQKAALKNKGRISRCLANKAALASRIDSFRETPTSIFGIKYKGQVEERMVFYEKGVKPRKNIDVMREAMLEVAKEEEGTKKEESKKRKSVAEVSEEPKKKSKKEKDGKEKNGKEKEKEKKEKKEDKEDKKKKDKKKKKDSSDDEDMEDVKEKKDKKDKKKDKKKKSKKD